MVAGNVTFPIYNSDGTSFNGLELKKSVYESVVMSLGDKITGDVYYPNNALVVTMKEYITYNGVKYVLVNPPTIVREGMVSDNGELKGMTKYSFTFYHPMYMLGNFPLCDVAVSSDQQRYLSENKTFFWIGNLTDFVAKLNKNLENTEWYCVINDSVSQADRQRLSEVMSFDKNTIADALKTGYETWDVPYIISIIPSTDPLYQQGKRFLIQYGLPSTEILVENAQNELVPFVFHFGQGVGLKNNSRTPRNNKIVTRIAGYGSEDNIQYGYPQIPYEGGDCQYPLYYGIVGGQRVQLIKHPFTRTHLMPSIYRETVNKKVNPMATGYDPTIELKDYYDADNTYENPIKPLEPSYEIHEFEKIKPELGQRSIVGVSAYSDKDLDSISLSSFISLLSEYYTESEYLKEKEELEKIINTIGTMSSNSGSVNTRAYYCDWSFTNDERYAYVKFESSALNFEYTVLMVSPSQDVEWDDTMDDDGNYVQSYFRITIPQLTFDLYASAAITQEMTINMRSGACLGCSFPVMVDWDDYKLNFYDADGNFAPNGSQRNYDKYPDSSQGQITLILQKETSTFGTLMPNTYQKPHIGDEFVILGISLPTTYITEAEARLDAEMKQYMRDNNVYYYDYPLKFDEHFLTTHAGILAQMDNNVIVRFDYAGTEHALYIKQVSVKYENKPLPTYDITLTDNIEVVLNQIGQVVDEVRRLHDNLGGVEVQPSNNYLRKDIDDTAYGMIRLIKGLQVGNRFVTGLLGEGGVFRKEEDGTTYLECDKLYVRMKAYFDTVEVRHYMHSAGNRVASNAGINCSRVEYIDSNGDVTQDVSEATLFRCYFRANDDGREVRNDFIVGDLAFCHETNVNTDSVDQHGYWRAVVGRNANGVLTDDGEGWIDLSVSDCQEGSGIPIAQDDIVQLGNKTDTTRQGAIIEFVSGADAPSYQIYQGINTYSLNGKNYIGLGYSSQNARAYLNVYGDAYIGDPNESSYIRYNAGTRNLEIKAKISAQSTIDGETLAQFISENTWTEEQIDALITAETDPLSDAIEDIRRQVDGNIATWFYDGVPTLQNLPASQWTTADDKNEHLGDLYYDNLTGYGYRFKYDDLNRQWSWGRITDVDVVKALADAAKAQDTADHKRRVFVVQPTPPYDAGDLWVNATYPSGNTETNEAQSKYYNDVLRCNTSKASGTTFAIADWSLASKYTDDQALEDFKANQYVIALTNGTISTNITNAQNAANTAQGTANSAATAAASAQAAAQAADSRAAALEYIKTALNQKTDIEGGLILTSLIAMRDANNHYWSGISGTYQSAETGTGYKGHGIAAWYGGAMVDKEVTTTATDYAKSLFRFDGSGYVASGNLSWDKNGNVTIQGYSINATTLQVGGVGVLTTTAAANTYLSKTDAASTYLTKTDAANTYLSIAFFNRLFRAYNGSTQVNPNDTTSTIDNIKAMFGFWTEQYISALGKGSGGSSGIDMATVWSALGNATTEQINATHLSNALSAYNPTSNFKTINGNSIIGTGDIVIQGGGGGDYLPLSGGTMTGTISSSVYPLVQHVDGTSIKMGLGYYKSGGYSFFSNDTNSYEIRIYNDGSLKYAKYQGTGSGLWNIYHSGNFNPSDYLPLTGGTMTGQINSVNIKPTTDNRAYIGDKSHQYVVAYVGYLNSGTGRPLVIASNDGDMDIYIDASHNIGIGHKSPTAKLDVSGTLNVSAATTLSSGLFVTGTNSSSDDGITITLQDKRYIGLILTNGKSSSETVTAELYADTTSKNSYWYLNIGGTAYNLTHPKKSGTIAVTSDLNDYLPLTGGTITANSASPLIINSTSSNNASFITFKKNGSGAAWIGYDSDLHTMIQSCKSPYPAICVKDDGTPCYVANARTKPFTFYELYHSGNFNPSYYLPLTGGTITSASQRPLTLKTTSTSSIGACYIQVITTAGKIAEFGYYGAVGTYIQNGSSTGGTTVSINDNGNVGISVATPSYKLHVNGTFYASGNSSIGGTLGVTGATTLSSTLGVTGAIMASGGITGVPSIAFSASGHFRMDEYANLHATTNTDTNHWNVYRYDGSSAISIKASSGNIGINTISPSYKLHVEGVIYSSTGVYSAGYVTALSDIRHKDVVSYDTGLSVSDVANAPMIRFLWKDRRQEGMQVGSIAQYWKKVMPEAIVENADGELTMSYGVIALLASIATARKVEEHERRIAELERENKLLKEQLNAA